MLDDVLAGIYVIISVFTLFGNSLTIAAIRQNPKLDTASNQFIFGLAIADLLVIFKLFNRVISFVPNCRIRLGYLIDNRAFF
jgi:hypothetical protein